MPDALLKCSSIYSHRSFIRKFFMSENPYAADTVSDYANDPLSNRAPTGMIIISVLMIILGLFGMLANCMAFAQPITNAWIEESLQTMPENQAKIQQMSLDLNRKNYPWTLTFAIINCLIAPALIIGSIGCLSRKSWGWGILTKATLAAAFFVFVRGVAGIFLQMPMVQQLSELSGGDPELEQIVTISTYVALAFGIVVLLAMTAFYFWSHFYLKRDRVRKYLGVVDYGPQADLPPYSDRKF